MILPSLANKGPVIVAQDLCRELVARGNTCKVFYFDDIVDLSFDCPTERIKFFDKFDISQWDVIHSHMLRPDFWVWWHKPHFSKTGTKFITTVHQNINETLTSDYGRCKGNIVGKLWRLMLRRFDKVVVLTRTHLQSIPEVKIGRKTVIHNGRNIDHSVEPDLQDVAAIEMLRQRCPVILGSNSIITKRKGLDQIIKALPMMPQCGYVVIGSGPELANLQQLAKNLAVESQCLWLGFKQKGYRYYKQIDIYMITSHSEGFPLSLIEAAAMGKPAICSDISIFRNVVDETQVVFAPIDDTERLVNAVANAIERRTSLSENIMKYYHSSLTSEVMCDNYLKIYDNSIDSNI